MDNYEWGSYKKHYGLYNVDRSNGLTRTKKKGATYFEKIVKASAI